MRVWAVAACTFLVLGAHEASAAWPTLGLGGASCNKGMLWPHVRQPGDCLTDEEIRSGQRGVYNGPVETDVDVSTLGSGPSFGAVTPAAPSAAQPAQASQPPAAAPPAATAAVTRPRAVEASCNKGMLWPFVRSAGDCLTDVEKEKNGRTGTYGNVATVSTAAISDGTLTDAGGAGTAGLSIEQATAENEAATASETGSAASQGAPACRKGWLWPFVREPGDCPTDAERRARN